LLYTPPPSSPCFPYTTLFRSHRITHGNRLVELKADDHLTLAGSQHLKLGTGQFIEAGEEIHYFAGEKLVLDAGSELTLKAGGSFIKLDAGGVSVVGAEVKLNSGGSAGAGSGVAIHMPLPPGAQEPEPQGQAAATRDHVTEETATESAPSVEHPRLPAPEGICLECWQKARQEEQALLAGESQ